MDMTGELDVFARFVGRVSLAMGCPPGTHGDGIVSAALAQRATITAARLVAQSHAAAVRSVAVYERRQGLDDPRERLILSARHFAAQSAQEQSLIALLDALAVLDYGCPGLDANPAAIVAANESSRDAAIVSRDRVVAAVRHYLAAHKSRHIEVRTAALTGLAEAIVGCP